jgi:glycosyltransferase involved in cell wall biosynthesis
MWANEDQRMFHRPVEACLSHIAVLGNALPRRCGLATYTSHSVQALRTFSPGLSVDHYAMDDGHGVVYGLDVAMTIPADDVSAYVRTAAAIRRSGAQLLWVHHEFGIFGGAAGDHLLALLRHLDIPLVVTLHTVLGQPNGDQRRVMNALVGRADRLIVMARTAAHLLESVYGADPARIQVIPHGAPDRPLLDPRSVKARLGLSEGPTVLTFGLLSPGKGIEYAIRALPAVVAHHPDLTYLIVGATHPALVRDQGETYRESLIALARDLGVEARVRFVDRFLDDEALLDHLQASDIYLTPYLGREQVTSGTLSYALALGRPVVSTPYVHAEEALADGIGTLVPFGDSGAISAALLDLLEDPAQLTAQARKVWQAARSTIWNQNARAVMDVFSDAKAGRPVTLPDQRKVTDKLVQISGIAAMTDSVGMIQHSVFGVPDRRHGYCIDDNARALMLVCTTRSGDPAERMRLAQIYAAFVEHGWNEETGTFRNFMGFDRRWLESEGSEDSNGRTLWALGEVMRAAPRDSLRRWATALFNRALPLVDRLIAPRAIAFAVLGMAAALEAEPDHAQCRALLRRSAETLKALLAQSQRPDWSWFEIVLAYDNARLPQAMIEAGRVLGDAEAVAIGLSTLRWLLGKQKSPAGHFRAVGTESFGKPFAEPAAFDQQPLEAAATIEACAAAYRADPDSAWLEAAGRALTWFEGDNDLGLPLVSEEGDLCYDGLTPQGVNLNLGAESILALQMARQAMAELSGETEPVPQLAIVR